MMLLMQELRLLFLRRRINCLVEHVQHDRRLVGGIDGRYVANAMYRTDRARSGPGVLLR